jgi:hypothetical protein
MQLAVVVEEVLEVLEEVLEEVEEVLVVAAAAAAVLVLVLAAAVVVVVVAPPPVDVVSLQPLRPCRLLYHLLQCGCCSCRARPLLAMAATPPTATRTAAASCRRSFVSAAAVSGCRDCTSLAQ